MKLFKHQQKIIDLNPKKHLLAWSTGVGKTLAAIKLADQNEGGTMIICPKSLVENWEAEIAEWADKTSSFFIITKETFRRDAKDLPYYPNIIVDEGHYFSGFTPKSQMFKSLNAYIKYHKPPCLWLLTATPYLSSPWNIYAYAMLFGLEWNWMEFKLKYFNEVRMGHRLIPVVKKGIEKDMARLVNQMGNTVKMEDAVDVPDSIFQTEYFDLTPVQKKAIKDLDDLMHIVRWTKIHQICGGTLKGDEYNKPQSFSSEKLNRLMDLAKEHPRLAVVCRYNYEIEILKEKLSEYNVYVIQGATKDKQEVIKQIDNSDSCIVLINSACSEGYNLGSIPIMIFYSYDFSLKNYVQMIGRIQRINAVQKCVYISLVVRKTIDEDVFKNVVIQKQDFHLAIYNNK